MIQDAPLIFGELPPEEPGHALLAERFVVPPFSVLDTRAGYWQERRRAWLSLGIKSEIGRGADLRETGSGSVYNGSSAWSGTRSAAVNRLSPGGSPKMAMTKAADGTLVRGDGRGRPLGAAFEIGTMQDGTTIGDGPTGTGTSIFDPVLCELAYRWFCPERGHVLDPFAGGSVRGIVAAYLGHPYTGIDLSARQLEANRQQAEEILRPDDEPQPTWIAGDSATMNSLLSPSARFDLVFTCPPYYDLEVYSDHPADLSNMDTYAGFITGFTAIIGLAASRLRQDRFMVLVVSEIRDKAGHCHGFVPDTIMAARQAGLRLYNEAILVNAAGSLPLRAGKYMESSRKLGRSHQNVLVFAKGNPGRGWSYERQDPPAPQLGLFE